MSKLTKIIGTLLLIAAVMGYTIFNYVKGTTPQGTFLAYMAILCIPFVNMVNILIRELKDR